MAVLVDPAAADFREALANPAPLAAPFPAVANPVLSAPPAPPACAASGSGATATGTVRTRYVRVLCVFVFVLVSYLQKFCVVLISIPGVFLSLRVSALAKHSTV